MVEGGMQQALTISLPITDHANIYTFATSVPVIPRHCRLRKISKSYLRTPEFHTTGLIELFQAHSSRNSDLSCRIYSQSWEQVWKFKDLLLHIFSGKILICFCSKIYEIVYDKCALKKLVLHNTKERGHLITVEGVRKFDILYRLVSAQRCIKQCMISLL